MQSPPSQHRTKWDIAETDYLRYLLWRGVPWRKIATRLQRSPGAVLSKIRQLERLRIP